MCIIALAGLAEMALDQDLVMGYIGLSVVALVGLVALERKSYVLLGIFIFLALLHSFLFVPFGVWIEPFHTDTMYPDLEYWNARYNTFAWIWTIILGISAILFALVVPRWKEWRKKDI